MLPSVQSHDHRLRLEFAQHSLELADAVNMYMPYHVVNKVADALNGESKSIKGSRILVVGVAYKKDIDDTRNSPALKVMELMLQRGAKNVQYNDPYVPEVSIEGQKMKSVDPNL